MIDETKIIHTQVYDDQHEQWIDKEMTIADFLDAYTNEGCPTVQPTADLSGYSDKLWKEAYERGKASVQPESKAIEDIKADIAIYEADCRLAGGEDCCEECNNNVFGSIYRIIDKHISKKEQT